MFYFRKRLIDMNLVFLDVETKLAFSSIESRDPGKLGVSFVGVFQRGEPDFVKTTKGNKEGYGSFFEKDLALLWPILEKADQVIGYNLNKFDFPAMNPYYPGDLLKLPTLDLLEIVNDSLGRRIRLDNLAQATLGKGKIGSGLDAIRYFENGELESLEKYCLKDVEVTRDVYDFGRKNGFWRYLTPPDVVREFQIKWPVIEAKEGISLTLGI